ncbi:hypothetical protein [Microvirga yunnanensis]|uniref:hypothetical protein n=1 Tax=Microvirga yunnanensis TaxID=2953740 RepID=UPI0021C5C91B|nr:hypothetical protein [Microvirga sp. HBU65207]
MANKRTISWNAAMRDLRNDRVRRAGVREERLRATAGLRSSSTLSSWRGRSGRRYIVGVHPLNETELLDVTDAVILAVKRDAAGTGIVVDAAMAASDPSEQPRMRWLARVRDRGATELHIHRLAATEDDRRAIFEDLRENETQDC